MGHNRFYVSISYMHAVFASFSVQEGDFTLTFLRTASCRVEYWDSDGWIYPVSVCCADKCHKPTKCHSPRQMSQQPSTNVTANDKCHNIASTNVTANDKCHNIASTNVTANDKCHTFASTNVTTNDKCHNITMITNDKCHKLPTKFQSSYHLDRLSYYLIGRM